MEYGVSEIYWFDLVEGLKSVAETEKVCVWGFGRVTL